MTLITISIIIATTIYFAYNTISVANFGVTDSLSMTYYLWKQKSNKGYVFSLMMYAEVALMMPSWITLSEGSDFQFLAFLAPAAIAFVGTAPKFLDDDLENRVHSIAALIAAVCSLAWVCLVTPYWWFIIVWTMVVAIASILTSTYKTAYVYWLETIAFFSTFCSAILYSI